MKNVNNKDAFIFINSGVEFKGSNTYGVNKGKVYAVYSYGEHFPIYAYIESKWYGNSDKYSASTSRHQSQLRPTGNIEYINTQTLKQLINEKSN